MQTKIAIVHDWLVNLGGAERCLAVFRDLFPEAALYTLFFDPESARKLGFDPRGTHSSFLQRLPSIRRWYPNYLFLYPLAVERLNLDGYDLVLSSSWAAAKGVLTRAHQLHICYCHTPMRYIWDLTQDYLAYSGLNSGIRGLVAAALMHYLRLWDVSTASRVDHFVANSAYVARRIEKIYRRKARVIYPPVDVERFTVRERKEEYFLCVSRLVQYKRIDLLVDAFNKLGHPLIIIGDGPERRRLEHRAAPNIKFLGRLSDDKVKNYMERARALVYAADEDFGIVPVEAQACGTPVIAYGRGGVTETVVPWKDGSRDATGVFFYEQTPQAVLGAVREFGEVEHQFSRLAIRSNAERFSRSRFEKEFMEFISEAWGNHLHGGSSFWDDHSGLT